MALTEGLVSYWKLDESSGNAADSVGGNTLTNTNSVSYVSGKINNGASLGTGNTNKRLYIASKLGITANTANTFACWIKINEQIATNGNWRFLDHRDGATGCFNWMSYEDASGTKTINFSFGRNGTADYVVSTTQTLTVGTWYHFVVTYNGSQSEGFFNGMSVGTSSGSGTGSGISDGFSLGSTANGFLYASLTLDEVGAWNRALTGVEVSQLYAAGNGLTYPFLPTNLKFRPGSLGSML